jgi:hypothetical protein
MMASFAPTRVKIRSTGESEQLSAATQQPSCAISTVRQACARREGLAGLVSREMELFLPCDMSACVAYGHLLDCRS